MKSKEYTNRQKEMIKEAIRIAKTNNESVDYLYFLYNEVDNSNN